MKLYETVENFYRYILPITQSIIKYIMILNDRDCIRKYKDIGVNIYKRTLDGSIDINEKLQEKIFQDLKDLNYLLERLNEFENIEFDSLDEVGKQVIKNVLGEIKINKPVLDFPEDKSWIYILKDEEEYNKINSILIKKGWTNGSKYDYNTHKSGNYYTILFSINPTLMKKTYMLSSTRLNGDGDKDFVLNKDRLKSINESKILKEVFQKEHAPILDKAVKYAIKYLEIPKPNIILINNPEYTKQHSSFGGYTPGDKNIRVVTYNRNLADITRSMFHELVHLKQDTEGRLESGAGQDGDEWENEANATAGTMMRKFSRENPEIFE